MKKLLLAAAMVAAAAFVPAQGSNANAAGISYPASVTGKWCFAEANDGWLYFKRRSKCEEMTLMLLHRRMTLDADRTFWNDLR